MASYDSKDSFRWMMRKTVESMAQFACTLLNMVNCTYEEVAMLQNCYLQTINFIW